MMHPLRRFASSPSLACGQRGTHPVARRSRFHGSTGLQMPLQADTAELALPGRWCRPLEGVTTKSARGGACLHG